jgi:hypothetical protein
VAKGEKTTAAVLLMILHARDFQAGSFFVL